jgi:hypothetical protein
MIDVVLLVHPECETSLSMFRALATPLVLHSRGWLKIGYKLRVTEKSRKNAIRVELTPQAVMDRMFPSFSNKKLSVCNMETREIFLSEARWRRQLPDDSSMSLPAYRCYLINHELGHALGKTVHENTCDAEGRASIMRQQTLGLGSCVSPTPFPLKK